MAVAALTDVPVLAKHTSQVAEAEEYRARPGPPTETIFLSKMRKGAANTGIATGIADPRFVCHSIDVAVARARTTVFQLTQSGLDAVANLVRR